MTTEFLALDEILALHAASLRQFGGETGVASVTLLQSAVVRPRTSVGGRMLHDGLHQQAAAYLFYLIRTVPSSTATSASAWPQRSPSSA